MRRLVEFPLEDGTSVWVEVEEVEGPGMVPAARGEGVPERARQTFEAALERVRPLAKAVICKLRTLADPPDEIDEIEVEFGLKLNAEAGAILAAAGTEAHYTVTLTWKREGKAGTSGG
ncbi:MAG: CU044_2847 family protein [Anaerolineae bacterium]|nr:CU044_2847 family protein [Anaerolineae bacterium]